VACFSLVPTAWRGGCPRSWTLPASEPAARTSAAFSCLDLDAAAAVMPTRLGTRLDTRRIERPRTQHGRHELQCGLVVVPPDLPREAPPREQLRGAQSVSACHRADRAARPITLGDVGRRRTSAASGLFMITVRAVGLSVAVSPCSGVAISAEANQMGSLTGFANQDMVRNRKRPALLAPHRRRDFWN
jgi:hypothetical protein